MAVLVSHLRYDWAQPGQPEQRPPHLLQGPRLAAALLDVQAAGVISDEELGRLPPLRQPLQGHPTPVLPWVDVATGSLGQGLPVGVGIALAGRYLDRLPYRVWVLCGDSEMAEGSMWEAFDKASLLPARQPDRDRRRQPARPARRDDARLGSRRLRRARRAFGWHAIEIDGHDVDGDRPGLRRRRSSTRARPTVIVAGRSRARASRRSRTSTGWHGKAARRTRTQAIAGARRRARHLCVEPRPPRLRRRAAPRRVGPARAACRLRRSARRSRRARPTATRSRRSARRGRTSSPSTARSATRPTRRCSPRRIPTATSRCSSPSSSSSPPRSACQVRGWRAVRLDLRRVLHPRLRLHPHGGDQPRRTSGSSARTQASRSARTVRRRWRWRTWR